MLSDLLFGVIGWRLPQWFWFEVPSSVCRSISSYLGFGCPAG